MSNHPPTIIVVHPKEKRRKCTVEPLRRRADFIFWKHPNIQWDQLEGYVRLGLNGPVLSKADAGHGLLMLDGTWRLAAKMEESVRGLPVRSLPNWKTAYPRISKLFDDPEQGLATIEAIYAAYTILGRDTDELLGGYRWKDEFLRLNRQSPR